MLLTGDAYLLRELCLVQDELRRFSQGVRPVALESGGLAEALPQLAAASPLPVELRADVPRLPPAVETAAWFVCAETLTNVAKHARAASARVQVTYHDGELIVVVVDDGTGGADPNGSGLRGLADRAEALGGRLDVSSGPGRTVVTARLPT